MAFYTTDLAYIHDVGFSGYARRAAPEIVRLLRGRDRAVHAARPAGQRSRQLIVEIGSGGGLVARALTDAGYRAVGLDISPAMIRLARSRAPRATFKRGSWATTPIPMCDAIVAIGEILSYDTRRGGRPDARRRQHEQDLSRLFERAFRSLRPGGLLIFDFMESTRRRTYRRFALSGKDWALVMRASANRSGTLLTRRLGLMRTIRGRKRRSQETHRVQIYSRRQMARMLEEAGFSVTLTRFIGRMRVFRSNVAAVCVKPGREPGCP